MKCRKCGQELSNDMRFCTNCGSPVAIPKPQKQTKMETSGVVILTTSIVPNYKVVQICGVINASIAEYKTKTLVGNLFGGNIAEDSLLSENYETHYNKVLKRLIDKARANNCNAIIGLRYNSDYLENFLCLTAYGTACVVEKE